MSPRRIKQQNIRGWKRPATAVSVGHGTKFDNPYRLSDFPAGGDAGEDRELLVSLFRELLEDSSLREQAGYPHPDYVRATPAGKDLMCGCSLDRPCHADVLLEVANPRPTDGPKPTPPSTEGT